MLSFFRSSDSTELKIRAAINDEPLGPYNMELMELADLTRDRKAFNIITHNIQKKLSKLNKNSDTLKRLHTFSGNSSNSLSGIQRSYTTHMPSSESVEYRIHIGVLKCLTVIVYLCQHGSPDFLHWLKSEYSNIICPIANLSFHPKTANAIYLKIELVVRYCENSTDPSSTGFPLDEMRSEMYFYKRHPKGIV